MDQLFHIGQKIGVMDATIQRHSEEFDDLKKRLDTLETWSTLNRRAMIVVILWVGSLTGQLTADQIASIAVGVLRRVLIGG